MTPIPGTEIVAQERRRLRLPALGRLIAAALVVGVALAVGAYTGFVSPDRQQSPDDALYASYAARWLAAQPLTTMSGDPATTRAPGYVLALAGAVAVVDSWTSAERLVATVVAAGIIAAAASIGWAMVGSLGAMTVAALVALPAVILAVGRSAIDGLQMLLVLSAVSLGLWAARRGWRAASAIIAGACIGLAILTKESALVMLPWPFLWALALPTADVRGLRWAGIATATAVIAIVPWWLWVYGADGRLFPTQSGGPVAILGLVMLGLLVPIALVFVLPRSGGTIAKVLDRLASGVRWWVVLAATFAWASLVVLAFPASDPRFGLTFRPSIAGVFESLRDISPLFVWPLGTVAAVLGGLVLATADLPRLRGLLIAAILPSGLIAIIVLKDWDARSAALVAVLANAILAIGVAALARSLMRRRNPMLRLSGAVAIASLVGLVLIGTALGLAEARRHPEPFTASQDWGNGAVRDAAAWLRENVPPGETIVSTWQFASGIDAFSDARHRIVEAPLLQLRIGRATESPLVPTGTLFRTHASVPSPTPTDWIYLRRHASTGYHVGLSATELLATLRDSGASHLVLTGEGTPMNSATMVSALEEWPGLDEVTRFGKGDAKVVIMSVDRDHLEAGPIPLQTNTATVRAWPTDVARVRNDISPGRLLRQILGDRDLEVAPDDPVGWALAGDLLLEP